MNQPTLLETKNLFYYNFLFGANIDYQTALKKAQDWRKERESR